jgi:hypothetical protein
MVSHPPIFWLLFCPFGDWRGGDIRMAIHAYVAPSHVLHGLGCGSGVLNKLKYLGLGQSLDGTIPTEM